MAKIIIEGNPVAKGRPRFTKRGFAYTPAKTKSAEEAIAWAWKEITKNNIYLENKPIRLHIDFYREIPKSTSKKRKIMMENKEILPTVKPDIDNYLKLVLDGLNGIAYKDDNLICDLRTRKFYSENPRIEIEMSEIAWT